ncbi:MAG: DegT/DnrJ/EryC1/StrS family aminotransferase [Oligoflexia bacterium]|nr:DegT/DnrJ/EryC1/StrS family aminotransferase [Oligoflexia bacterium]
MSSYNFFFELDSQYSLLKSSIEDRFKKIIEHKLFINGPEVQELEKKLANYVDVPFAYCANNGTNSLIISLLAVGVKPGDEVITSPLSFGATAMSILILGAVPVFVDIEPETGLMAVNHIESAITKNTKAILPVSLYGQTCDMDAINDIAKKYNLAVIEDACQSFGADYKGKKSGALSLISAVSFFPGKALGAYGNGGCVFTKDKELGKKIRSIRNQGQSKSLFYEFVGINALMDTFQAGVLLEKLKLFDEELRIRQKKADKYDHVFQTGQWEVKPIQVKKDRASAISFYVLKSDKRDQILKEFNKFEKPLPVYYPSPLFDQPAIEPRCKVHGDPQIARSFAEQVFSLPCHAYLKDSDQEDIIQLMRKVNSSLKNYTAPV